MPPSSQPTPSSSASHPWIYPLLAACGLGLLGWWANHTVEGEVENTLHRGLQTVLSADINALQIWMESQRKLAVALANNNALQGAVQELIDLSERSNGGLDSLFKSTAQRRLQHLLGANVKVAGFHGYAVISREGAVVGTQRRGLLGLAIRRDRPGLERVFSSGETQMIAPFVIPPRGKPGGSRPRFRTRLHRPTDRDLGDRLLMMVTSPVKNAQGEVIAALGLMLRPEAEFTRILSVARYDQSGETFAFNSEAWMLSRSRFDEHLKQLGLLPEGPDINSVLRIQLREPGDTSAQDSTSVDAPSFTRIGEDARQQQSGIDLKGFADYRGVPVVGAWEWLDEYGFGVATKVDVAEAYN